MTWADDDRVRCRAWWAHSFGSSGSSQSIVGDVADHFFNHRLGGAQGLGIGACCLLKSPHAPFDLLTYRRVEHCQASRRLAQALQLDFVSIRERRLFFLEIPQVVEPHAAKQCPFMIHDLAQSLHQCHQDGGLLQRLHYLISWALRIS